ncbi:peptidoglycan DD-metalloendopeptidase family protein [Terribacillus sp. DMT04]|nr:peptidoglycan DD-metalloendopeptidase family protein [Terribacillus sp. DMT04]
MALFIKPSAGRLTNGFQGASSSHNGVDWAQSGTVRVAAAAAGTVSRSYVSSSYGEVIFIVHQLDGQKYETVYAHLRSGSRQVGVGDTVRQGQFIGYMGNTGDSTGQHLHFELHRGRWNANKTNAVNPLGYIGAGSSASQNSAGTAYPGSYIRTGSRGENVRKIQRAVGVTVDGIFGPNTRQAVINFQRNNGLGVDGIVGPETWNKLF